MDLSSSTETEFANSLNDRLRKISTNVEKTEPNDILSLRSRLAELDASNKILASKLNEIVDVVTSGPDNRIIELEMKLRQLETEKNELDYHMNVTKKEQTEHIDKLVDSIRRISAQNAELEIHVRSLKNKVPNLEELTRRQETSIETIKQKYNDSTFEKIKDMEKNIMVLEDSNRRLEEQVDKMTERQSQMTDEAEQKMKQTFEQKLELESKITKLKGKIKDMERINNDLLARLEEMKSKALEVAESDKEKSVRVSNELELLHEQLLTLKDEKKKIETDNANFRKEMKIMKVKLVAYEKELENERYGTN